MFSNSGRSRNISEAEEVVPSIMKAGSTNQYDRGRAISYANNYAGYVNSDGYFWTNGSDYALLSLAKRYRFKPPGKP